MAINFPKKKDKTKLEIIKLVKILAWNRYKLENKGNGTGLDLYKQFETEWLNYEIHSKSIKEIEKFIYSLGYTLEDLFPFN